MLVTTPWCTKLSSNVHTTYFLAVPTKMYPSKFGFFHNRNCQWQPTHCATCSSWYVLRALSTRVLASDRWAICRKSQNFLLLNFCAFIRFELDAAGVLSRYRLFEMQAAESMVASREPSGRVKTVVSILSLLYCALWCLFLIYAAFVSLTVCKFLKLASLPVDRWITWRLRGVCIRQEISWYQVCRMLR